MSKRLGPNLVCQNSITHILLPFRVVFFKRPLALYASFLAREVINALPRRRPCKRRGIGYETIRTFHPLSGTRAASAPAPGLGPITILLITGGRR
jgi:hypothetical protein